MGQGAVDYCVPVLDHNLNERTLDLHALMLECLALPSVRALLGSRRLRPKLFVRRRKQVPGATGRARYRDSRITITLSMVERERVEELMLHEVMHLVIGVSGHGGGRAEHHGRAYRTALLQAAFEMWPEIRGEVRNEGRCYDMDDRIWHRVRAHRALPSVANL